MIYRSASKSLAILLVLSASACAANKQIRVNSTPPGAEVSVDGRHFGKTPLTLTTNDIMPDRVTDGRPSTQAVLTVTKPGYEEYTLILREFGLPDEINAQLKGVGIAENLENYLDQNPPLLSATVASTAPPAIQTSQDLDADSERLYRSGHLLVAYSGFSAEGIALESVKTQAQALGAAVVLVQSKFAGLETELRAVTTRTSGGVATSVASGSVTATQQGSTSTQALGSGGHASASGMYSGTGSAYYTGSGFTILPSRATTEFVPFSKRQYDNQITYWRKRRPNALGVYCDYLPESLRRELQRNTGAYVIGLEEAGPAFMANVLVGDVIVAVDSAPVNIPSDIQLAAESARGRSAEIEVLRAGQIVKLSATIHER